MALLDAAEVVAGYGDTEILHGVSIRVNEGEIVTIIGPNGCGKSTLMKTFVGLVPVKGGTVVFRDQDISSETPGRSFEPDCATSRRRPTSFLRYRSERTWTWERLPARTTTERGSTNVPDVSRPGCAPEREGGQPLRRSAADAGNRPGADARSGVAAARRALGRSVPGGEGVCLRTDPGNQRRRRHGPACGAERPRGAEGIGQGYVLSAGENRLEDAGSALLDNPEVGRLYLGG